MQILQNRITAIKSKRTPKQFLICSFLLPILFLAICFVLEKVHPFGDRQILVTDFWHQYYPFLRLLHEKLQNGESLLYTWDSGLGTNFLSMMAYYTASPLNLLTVLVPDSLLREAVTLVLMLKVGFAGLFFAMFLKGTFRRNDYSICLFSVMYALCSYILGYYWNIIWLDTVALLPLVMLGLVYMVRDGRYRLYVIALGLSLFTNYYIGMFTCIFSVLAFLCLLVFYVPLRQVPGRIGGMFVFSLLGAALAAVILLPAFYGLQLTHNVSNIFPNKVEFYESWRTILGNLISYHAPTAKEGLPNLACGVLPLLLIGPFLRSRSIRIREKIAAFLLLTFLLFSCNCNILNYIWHGMHFPNMLPYRFSFLFSFVLLTLAYRAFELVVEEKQRIWDIGVMVLVMAGLFFLSNGVQEKRAIYGTLVTAVFYILILLLSFRQILGKRAMYVGLSLVMAVEMFCNTRVGVSEVGTSDYNSYPFVVDSVKSLQQQLEEQDDSLFYRMEMSSEYTLNDPALYGYHGLSQFSSTANEAVTIWMRSLGLPASEAGNRYFYSGGSPVTNMFTGIRYLICRSQRTCGTDGWEEITSDNGNYAYRNRYDLPIGFLTDPALLEYTCAPEANPFDNQNKLFRLATGLDTPLFTKVEVDSVAFEGINATKSGYGTFRFQAAPEAETHSITLQYRLPLDSILYGYASVTSGVTAYVNCGERKVASYGLSKQPYIFPMGEYAGAEDASIRVLMQKEATTGLAAVYAYALNTDVLRQGYEKLAAGGVTYTDFSNTKVDVQVNAQSASLCYFSIPYESGWQASVDGTSVEITPVGDAMVAVPVTQGTHRITLRYCPKGFVSGLILSVTAILLLLLLAYIEKRYLPLLTPICRKHANAPEDNTETEQESV